MNETILLTLFSIVIIAIFSLNFNSKFTDMTFKKAKNSYAAWYWFRLFKVQETKENFVKMQKSASIFVISVMILTLILIATNSKH